MELVLQPELQKQLDLLVVHATGSYIFYGPTGVGKYTSAQWLGQRLNCQKDDPEVCSNCRLISSGNYPDLTVIKPDGLSIGINQIQDLAQILGFSQFKSPGRRVIIIDQAELMTIEAQNSSLKLLEEPPRGSLIILVTQEADRLLPTVRSRCAKLYFPVLAFSQVKTHLDKLNIDDSQAIAELSAGRIGLAINLAQNPHLRAHYQNAAEIVDQVLSSDLFHRLVLASKLAESADTLEIFVNLLTTKIRRRLRSMNPVMPSAGHQLQAIEQFRTYTGANVTLRAALEGLMLGL